MRGVAENPTADAERLAALEDRVARAEQQLLDQQRALQQLAAGVADVVRQVNDGFSTYHASLLSVVAALPEGSKRDDNQPHT